MVNAKHLGIEDEHGAARHAHTLGAPPGRGKSRARARVISGEAPLMGPPSLAGAVWWCLAAAAAATLPGAAASDGGGIAVHSLGEATLLGDAVHTRERLDALRERVAAVRTPRLSRSFAPLAFCPLVIHSVALTLVLRGFMFR